MSAVVDEIRVVLSELPRRKRIRAKVSLFLGAVAFRLAPSELKATLVQMGESAEESMEA